ncbi:MAG: hypothetical protein QXL14_02385 [Candidatus Aenigmatarchaeota archaeon]
MFDWIKNIINLPKIEERKGFPKTLTKADFNLAGGSSQTLVAGVWNTIGTFVVPAQQKYRFGYGNPQAPENQGYLYVDLKDTSATPVQIEGTIRLVYSDASGLRKQVIFEERTNVLRGSATDRRQMKPLPEAPCGLRADGWAGEDDRLIIELRPDATATLSYNNSTIYIPATQIA